MPSVGRFGSQLTHREITDLPDAPGDVHYPNVKVNLRGVGGNAHAIVGAVRQGMRRARPRIDDETIEAFTQEATGGSYDELIQTCLAWVDLTLEG